MGVVRYSRSVPIDPASTTVSPQQASLAWPGTEETAQSVTASVMSTTCTQTNPASRSLAVSA